MSGNHKRNRSQLGSPLQALHKKKKPRPMTAPQKAQEYAEHCLTIPKDWRFTIARALALQCSINTFKDAYNKESYNLPDNAVRPPPSLTPSIPSRPCPSLPPYYSRNPLTPEPPGTQSPNETQHAALRRDLLRRAREVEQALQNTFHDPDTRVDLLPAGHPLNVLLTRYQTDLAVWTADWEAHVLPLHRHREAKQSWRERRSDRDDEEDDDEPDVQYQADDEADGDVRGQRRAASGKKVRASWYANRKQQNRDRGNLLTKENPGPVREWEKPNFARDATPPGVTPRSDWAIPDHVKTHADLDVYMNQMGLKKTKVAQSLLM
ncbi:hypothetical protein CMUS01_15808 [Colletotrichum musicola]|uniref:Uncharacterized protein n=1 Tax=Colletotrichum musicola TaxID=2175873 RepID=A0A8H6IU32_9PEZI|nr:hypothetical protein CMUS01_15808 [Colletotrichum musicola]